MKKYHLAIWPLLILFETLAQVFTKSAANHLSGGSLGKWLIAIITMPWVWVAVGCYIASFFTWMMILKKHDLGFSFLVSSLCYVTVILSSWLIFKEPLTLLEITGTIFIVSGIILLSRA